MAMPATSTALDEAGAPNRLALVKIASVSFVRPSWHGC